MTNSKRAVLYQGLLDKEEHLQYLTVFIRMNIALGNPSYGQMNNNIGNKEYKGVS